MFKDERQSQPMVFASGRCVVAIALLVFFASVFMPSSVLADSDGATNNQTINMYRLYNPYSGEHFYTAFSQEVGSCVVQGWRYEGVGWSAPVESETPVYRLYNPFAGDHHYTTDAQESVSLQAAGWKYEGVGWYSDDAKTVSLYREYNPNAIVGTHNFTGDSVEHESLVEKGWKDEGVAWYAAGLPSNADVPKSTGKNAAELGLTVTGDSEAVYRMFNKLTSEHLFTADASEVGKLLVSNWAYEGAAWVAPKFSDTPVYRLYNEATEDHMYSQNAAEVKNLMSAGWKNQGICWYSDDAKAYPVYRAHNPYVKTANHHFTASKIELRNLVSAGWKDEGIAWYATSAGEEHDDSIDSQAKYLVEVQKVSGGYSTAYVKSVDSGQVIKAIRVWCGANTFTGTFSVKHTAYALDKNPTIIGGQSYDAREINGWWVCYVEDWKSTPDDPNRSRKGCDQGTHQNEYDEGQGFHYGLPGGSRGCILIPDKNDAAWFYETMKTAIGSTVMIN